MFDWLKKTIAGKQDAAKASAAASPAEAEAQRLGLSHKNRGDEYLEDDAFDEAVECYRQAIAACPRLAEAHSLLGDALREQGKSAEAMPCYRKALELASDFPDAHFGLGAALVEKSDYQNAAVCFENALALKPDFVRAQNSLGFALLEQGKRAEAIACFRKSLQIEPDDGMAAHLLASLTRSNPERAPTQYVEHLFDGFSRNFDAQLQSLKYETPKDLVSLIAQHAAPPAGNWDILDLGCGTGLVGVAIAPYAGRLVGVDLSAKMLEKARVRNLYSRLEHVDLLDLMQNEGASSYDAVVAADTFIYLGKLDDVSRAAKRLLRPGGYFAFSVESLEALPGVEAAERALPDYRLQEIPSCRFAHSAGYISRLASDNSFRVVELKTAPLRMSQGGWISGYLALLQA